MEDQNVSDEAAQLREKAFQQLKAKALAGALGLAGDRDLLAALQLDSKRFFNSGGWWQVRTK